MAKNVLKSGEKILFGIFGAFIVLAVISFTIMEVVRARSTKPMYTVSTHYDFSPEGQVGSGAFRESGCTACHRALRNGTNMALSLDGIGSRRTLEWIVEFLNNPEKVYEARTIDHGPAPKEAAFVAKMPQEKLHAIAVFLSELKADQGSASARLPPEGRSPFIDDMVKMWAPKDWDEKYKDVRKEASDNSATTP